MTSCRSSKSTAESRTAERTADAAERVVTVYVHDTVYNTVHDTVRETNTVLLTPEGDTAIGFTDNTDQKKPVHYYLKVGESRGGWLVKEADPKTASMTIEKNGIEVSLTLGGDSAKGAGTTENARTDAAAPARRSSLLGGGASLGARRRMRLEREEAEKRKTEEERAKAEEERAQREAEAKAREAEREAQREIEREEQRRQLEQLKEEIRKNREEQQRTREQEASGEGQGDAAAEGE